ncbi:YcjX family protein [Guyparkeria sp.]|uniref:YcjX family protein n=1 Tax=Guyparkeria sp. TaxID=2035736 RepID=UPI00356589B7
MAHEDRPKSATSCPVMRIGITGLSGAGKSTLITAIINHLENARRGAMDAQPGLAAIRHGRWQREYERAFDYDHALTALTAEPPSWPESTRDWSIARITLDYDRRWYSLRPRRRCLELFDYPGEWLLDLSLLDWGFDDYTRHWVDWLSRSPRRHIAPGLLDDLAAIDPGEPVDEARMRELTARWSMMLADSRLPPHRLSRNLPGRWLMPGGDYDPEAMPFLPLPAMLHATGQDDPDGSWGQVCRTHFEYYREKIARPFFESHFGRLDAQVILVDLLGALRSGQSALADMRAALEAILEPFRYRSEGWLSNLFRRRIRRVAIVATQIDHLLPADQARLTRLLDSYLFELTQQLAGKDIELRLFAVSAVTAAQPREDARGRPMLVGVEKSSWQKIAFTPPSIPEQMPHDLNLAIDDLPTLAPPAGLDRARTFPGRRVDTLLDFLIGEH